MTDISTPKPALTFPATDPATGPAVADKGLVVLPVMMEGVWPDEKSRPCLRTVKNLLKRRVIPVVKIGRRNYFEIPRVRAALRAKCEVPAI